MNTTACIREFERYCHRNKVVCCFFLRGISCISRWYPSTGPTLRQESCVAYAASCMPAVYTITQCPRVHSLPGTPINASDGQLVVSEAVYRTLKFSAAQLVQ